MMLDGFFGVFALGAGLYCLYGYYLLKVKKKISKTILLPKDVDVRKCKDLDGYCRDVGKILLCLGIVVTLYGCADLYHSFVGGIDIAYMIMLAVLIITLLVFMVKLRKYNKIYFGII